MSEDKNKTWKLQKSIKLGDGYEYLGEVNLESGKPHGQGTKTRIGGEEQVGEFKDGNFVQGKVIQPSSTECALEFNDKEWVEEEHNNTTRISFLKLWEKEEPMIENTFGNKVDLYVGEMKNGKRHGKGKFKEYIVDVDDENLQTFLSAYYDGDWKEDKMDGCGTFIMFMEEKYVGEWKEDEYHGEGTYTKYGGHDHGGPGELFWIKGVWNKGVLEKIIEEHGKHYIDIGSHP